MYENLKKLLFKCDPEKVHNFAEMALNCAQKTPFALEFLAKNYAFVDRSLSQKIWDLEFFSPLGLAAGFDKNGTMIRALTALGFGFVEAGTVTPVAQSGNPKPRIWRHIDKSSLQNAMGFNNNGVEALVKRVEKLKPFVAPIGINVGKNKLTSTENALNDYKICVEKSHNVADYLVFNLSSPNTPALRDLQSESFVKELFVMAKKITKKPALLKIAPDLDPANAVEISRSAISNGADGIIATNTTNDYTLISGSETNGGGLSGEVLRLKSRELFGTLAKEFFGKTVLISAGGIMDSDEAYRRIKLGASLVQGYTGFIYAGPEYAKGVLAGVVKLMKQDGFSHISEAIGADLR